MAQSKNYTIETAQSSSTEWTFIGDASQAPFGLNSGFIRHSCVPRIEGNASALTLNLRESRCQMPPPSKVVFDTISRGLTQVYTPNLDYDQALTFALIDSTTEVYTPDLDFDESVTFTHIASTEQTHTPNLDWDISLALTHIASTSTIHTPNLDFDNIINFPLIAASETLHTPEVTTLNRIVTPFIASTEQTHTPNLDWDRILTLAHISSTSAVYDPNLDSDESITFTHIDPTLTMYEPTMSTSYSLTSAYIDSTLTVYTPNVDYSQPLTLTYINSTSQLYTPTLGYEQTSTLAYIDSTLQVYTPNVDYSQPLTLTYIDSTLTVYTPNVDYSQPLTLTYIASSAQLFVPALTASSDEEVSLYTQIVSASNPNNSVSMHVGSLYLDARTYTTFGAMITDIQGGVGGQNVHAELKRFTGGTSLVQLNNTGTAGATWRSVTTSDLVVSNSDWYDIYISASANQSIAFNGTNGESQLTVADNASLSFGADGTTGNEPSFTWAAWVKPTTLGMTPFGIVSKILTGGSGDEYFFGHAGLAGLTFLIADGAGFADDYIAQTNVTLTASVWQHVCATYDGSRGTGGMKIYVNGADESNVALSPGSYTAMSNSSADLVIGRKWSGLTTNVAEGFIDEVAAFDKELSAAEVSELYNSGSALNLSGSSMVSDIVSWWRMGDNATGTSPNYTIPDQIGSNDATMTDFQGDSTSGVVSGAVDYPATSSIRGIFYEY